MKFAKWILKVAALVTAVSYGSTALIVSFTTWSFEHLNMAEWEPGERFCFLAWWACCFLLLSCIEELAD